MRILRTWLQTRDFDCEEDGCDGKQVRVQTQLASLPRVLIVHLIRFKFVQHAGGAFSLTKLNDAVEFPDQLHLDKAWLTSTVQGPAPLDLDAAAADRQAKDGLRLPASLTCGTPSRKWICNTCTFENIKYAKCCTMCNASAPAHVRAACVPLPTSSEAGAGAGAAAGASPSRTSLRRMSSTEDTPVQIPGDLAPSYSLHVCTPVGRSFFAPASTFHLICSLRFYWGCTPIPAQGVIRHHGDKATSGHYTADVRGHVTIGTPPAAAGTLNNWRKFNDERVSKTKSEAVLAGKRTPYMLVYVLNA